MVGAPANAKLSTETVDNSRRLWKTLGTRVAVGGTMRGADGPERDDRRGFLWHESSPSPTRKAASARRRPPSTWQVRWPKVVTESCVWTWTHRRISRLASV